MKKIFLLYFALITLGLSFVSCLESDDNDIELYPYAVLRSVSIGDIITKYTIKAADGSDSTVSRTVDGKEYPLAIDQTNNLAYNTDSLPAGTDITRVATDISCDGIAYLYVDSLDSYELLTDSDSLDYSNPVKILVASTDGSYAREYKISLNVHKVDPDQLSWNMVSVNPVSQSSSVRLLLKNDSLYLFGCDSDGKLTLSVSAVSPTLSWNVQTVETPLNLNMNSLSLFDNVFYAISAGDLYVSFNGYDWTKQECSDSISALFAASDKDDTMWAVVNDSLAYMNDLSSGFNFVQPLENEFPLYDLSSVIVPLRTNKNINRYILAGRTSENAKEQPRVWSRLSTEANWTNYVPSSYNEKLCPALESLVVVSYDDKLYAIGGKGVVNGVNVDALSVIYVSRDNGLTWEIPKSNAPSLPSALAGVNEPFTAFVDSESETLWLVVCGEKGTIWRGRMGKFDL